MLQYNKEQNNDTIKKKLCLSISPADSITTTVQGGTESPEHGLSPLQLWHRGMLSARPTWQQDIADGFCVPPDYGIEESEYFVNSFHHV